MPDHSDGQSWRAARGRKPQVPAPSPQAAANHGRKKRPELAMADPVPTFAMDVALREITTIPAAALHRSAAHAWAARAAACYRVCLGKLDLQEGLSYLCLGEHYREAALAQAGFGEAWQPLQAEVEAVMAADRLEASAAMRRRSAANPGATP